MVPPPTAQAISDEVTSIHALGYERELTAPAITELAPDLVTCRLAFALTEADELLMARGLHDSVHAARGAFQASLSPALRAAVERATGRTVIEHASDTDLHSRVTIETFQLAPAATP